MTTDTPRTDACSACGTTDDQAAGRCERADCPYRCGSDTPLVDACVAQGYKGVSELCTLAKRLERDLRECVELLGELENDDTMTANEFVDLARRARRLLARLKETL